MSFGHKNWGTTRGDLVVRADLESCKTMVKEGNTANKLGHSGVRRTSRSYGDEVR